LLIQINKGIQLFVASPLTSEPIVLDTIELGLKYDLKSFLLQRKRDEEYMSNNLQILLQKLKQYDEK
jgi:hypothetical protein